MTIVNTLIQDLESEGITISNVYDLVNSKQKYTNALPVLIRYIDAYQSGDEAELEGVVRALAVKESKGVANQPLIDLFQRIPSEKTLLRWAIGSSIEVLITKENVPGILELVRDQENGMARQMLVLALGKFPTPEVEQVLLEILNQDEVTAHAVTALGQIKSQKARPQLEKILDHKNSLVRKNVRKALKRIGD